MKSIIANTTTVMARSAAPIIRYLLILSNLRALSSDVPSIPDLFTSPQTNSKTRATAERSTITVANCSVLFNALSYLSRVSEIWVMSSIARTCANDERSIIKPCLHMSQPTVHEPEEILKVDSDARIARLGFRPERVRYQCLG